MQRLGVSMIHQELNLLNELTVAQNIFLMPGAARPVTGLIDCNEDERGGRAVLAALGEKIDPRRKVR